MSDKILAHLLAELGLPLKLTAVNTIDHDGGAIVQGTTYEFTGFDAVPNEPLDRAAVGYIEQSGGGYIQARILLVDNDEYVLNDHAQSTVAFVIKRETIDGAMEAINSNLWRAEILRQQEGFDKLVAALNEPKDRVSPVDRPTMHAGYTFYTFKPEFCDFGDINAPVLPIFVKLSNIHNPTVELDGCVYSRPDTLVSHVQPNGVILRMALEGYRLKEIVIPDEYKFDTEAPAGSTRFSLHIRSTNV